MHVKNLYKCIEHLCNERVIIYPTDSVFGLGCDPESKKAVMSILKIKKRNINKGLILISSEYDQIKKYISKKNIPESNINKFYKLWPGPFTLLHPANKNVPIWIRGNSKFVALRITSNKYIKKICKNFGKAIVSTSANLSGFNPCKNKKDIKLQFGNKIYIMNGYVDHSKKPSSIINIINGEYIRNG
ncbi:Sua5/YciO/YrdC/YwlC family protein [Buchnera aphidicola (Ceratoglyphina bambusae)]|uniref:Sua5/YciO/YrdC/YwlC family protein n=1 Tax=Buchnera aphidicola TaxID=9 RepID=UPI0031B7F188